MASDLRLLTLVLSAFLILLPHAHATDVSYCDGKGDYPVLVKGVDIQPNPVKSGKPAKFSISASTADSIKAGKMEINVAYFGFYIHQETHDLCKETKCPVKGDFVMTHSQSLPFFTPPGSYTLQMKVFGESGTQLTCITFDFSIGFLPAADI